MRTEWPAARQQQERHGSWFYQQLFMRKIDQIGIKQKMSVE